MFYMEKILICNNVPQLLRVPPQAVVVRLADVNLTATIPSKEILLTKIPYGNTGLSVNGRKFLQLGLPRLTTKF